MNKRTTKKLALRAFEKMKRNKGPKIREQQAFLKYSKKAIKHNNNIIM